MLIQEKINAPDPLLKLYVAIDEDLTVLHSPLRAKQFPYDPWGGMPSLSAAEVLTIEEFIRERERHPDYTSRRLSKGSSKQICDSILRER
jgi:hypothetical protein